VLLKVFAVAGRFPLRPDDVPLAPAEAIAPQVGVPAAAWWDYAWQGRTIESHCAQIRAALGFREATDEDAAALARWLTGQALALERRHRPIQPGPDEFRPGYAILKDGRVARRRQRVMLILRVLVISGAGASSASRLQRFFEIKSSKSRTDRLQGAGALSYLFADKPVT